MSRVAIFEGLGRRRKHSKKFGVSPKAKAGRHWHQNKNRARGAKTPAQMRFKLAAKACKVEFSRKGKTPIAKRRAFNSCIKNILLNRKAKK